MRSTSDKSSLRLKAIMSTILAFLSLRTHRKRHTTKGDNEASRGAPFSPHLSAAPQTAQNALMFALQTLSAVCRNLPVGAILSSVIDPLLDIMDRIGQISSNTQGLVELAARIELLTPIVAEMAKDRPAQARIVVNSLNRELQSITKDLQDAHVQGRLQKFFNSADNASSLVRHNTTLDQMIADSTFVTVHEVHKSLRDLERRPNLLQSAQGKRSSQLHNVALMSIAAQVEMGNIRGGVGGTGGRGRIGGEGGHGEGPNLVTTPDYHWKIGNISGGIGGIGGEGIDVGGRGGTGKAPVISILRTN
ncbi:hypothetical protein C8R44DRAFT_386209 [Mycena epipterygia]|nr:hypothetical protein C8R44DRAFT_386209 [Mycena epipterygia]